MEQKPDNSTSQKPNAAPENVSSQPSAANRSTEPGSGIRSMKTTTAFRVVNFELYAKPVSS